MDRSEHAVGSAPAVRVRAQVPDGLDQVWPAITEPVQLARWFGAADFGAADLAGEAGSAGRFDFDDGDFFVVTGRRVVDRQLVEFDWSFLGVGPVQRIRWSVREVPGGTEVLLEDDDPNRSPAEADQMLAGWTDFAGRLARYLCTGEVSRYDWREEIDGGVDLAGGWHPLRLPELYRWLPVASDGFRPRWFFVVDEDGPRRFELSDWKLHDNVALTFSLAIPDAIRHTSCMVTVEPLFTGQRLRFSHTGWRALGLPDSRARALRRRFAAAWTHSLDHARGLSTGHN